MKRIMLILLYFVAGLTGFVYFQDSQDGFGMAVSLLTILAGLYESYVMVRYGSRC